MSARKLYPEIDLPAKMLDVIKEYVGPRRMARLSSDQRTMLNEICGETGKAVARALTEAPGGPS